MLVPGMEIPMYWFYLVLMLVLVLLFGYGTYYCSMRVDNFRSAIHFVGAIVLGLCTFITLVLGLKAVQKSNSVERSNVLITSVVSTVENNLPMKVTLQGVFANKNSAYYVCDNPFEVQQCTQLAPGDVVVFVDTYNEFGFGQTSIEFPESSTDPE